MPEKAPFKHKHADESPGFLLYKMTSLWQQRLGRIFDGFGIYQTQYAILASLRYFEEKGEPSTQTHLAEHARLDKMTLSKAVRSLEKAALVKRQPSSSDHRAIVVRLTPKGRNLVGRAIVAIENADDEFFGVLTPEDLARFQSLMKEITARNSDVSRA